MKHKAYNREMAGRGVPVARLEGSVVMQWPQGTAPEPDVILDEIFAP